MDEEEEITYEEFQEKAESILPGTYLGEMEIAGGYASYVQVSAVENENDSYNIYIVPDPDGDYSIEPEYYDFETVEKKEIKKWLKEHGFEEDSLDA